MNPCVPDELATLDPPATLAPLHSGRSQRVKRTLGYVGGAARSTLVAHGDPVLRVLGFHLGIGVDFRLSPSSRPLGDEHATFVNIDHFQRNGTDVPERVKDVRRRHYDLAFFAHDAFVANG